MYLHLSINLSMSPMHLEQILNMVQVTSKHLHLFLYIDLWFSLMLPLAYHLTEQFELLELHIPIQDFQIIHFPLQ